jgi:cobalamin biosynthetic protein CobC
VSPRDHGGGIDAARARWGGARADWLDLSTGINPEPYPLPPLPDDAWTALPDTAATDRLERAARAFWSVPDGAEIVAAPGASALIARLPEAFVGMGDRTVHIPGPTYNEHAAAFAAAGWREDLAARLRVLVHPNNPDGRLWAAADLGPAAIVDESFADVTSGASMVAEAARPGVVVLKSFGKFWGLAGLRLGFAIASPEMAARLRAALGPWPVSGPALAIGVAALEDAAWAEATRTRLRADAARLDAAMAPLGARVGGCDLFRLYDVGDAQALRDRLAARRIWTRAFPYSRGWLRLGLPPRRGWDRLRAALAP